jgi:hypothetical protein
MPNVVIVHWITWTHRAPPRLPTGSGGTCISGGGRGEGAPQRRSALLASAIRAPARPALASQPLPRPRAARAAAGGGAPTRRPAGRASGAGWGGLGRAARRACGSSPRASWARPCLPPPAAAAGSTCIRRQWGATASASGAGQRGGAGGAGHAMRRAGGCNPRAVPARPCLPPSWSSFQWPRDLL